MWSAWWLARGRLRRLARVEVGVFCVGLSERLKKKAERWARRVLRMSEAEEVPYDVLMEVRRRDEVLEELEEVYESAPEADLERRKELLRVQVEACYNAIGDLEEAAEKLQEEPALSGQVFIRASTEGDTFSKLSRYETSIERSLYRALHELERVQARRAGRPVAPPR